MPAPISVQLYTVRDAISEDLARTLDRVATIGFTKVEPYRFVERADEYATALAAAGLTAPSAHAPVIDSATPERTFEAAAGLGIETVIDPFVPTERWQTADDAARNADRVNELAVLAARFGLRFGYHNHNWEFANQVDGRSVYRLFAERLTDQVVLEVDTFWSTVGGADTPALLSDLGDRVHYLHIKDGRVAGDIATALPSSRSALEVPAELMAAFKQQVPAGSGDVDVSAILAAAPTAVRVVEFDGYAGDVFDGIALSLAWLKANDK